MCDTHVRCVPRLGANPLDRAIRAIPAAWFRPDPRIYWPDMLASAAIGWIAFAFAVGAGPRARAALLIVSAFALYRAVLFIHELTHLAPREVAAVPRRLERPRRRAAAHPLVSLRRGPHRPPSAALLRHAARPGIRPVRPPPADPDRDLRDRLAAVPLLLAVRFALVAPISWIVPPLRRLTVGAMLGAGHQPRITSGARPSARPAWSQEAAACAARLGVFGLWWVGVVPRAALGCWLFVGGAASAVNAVRTLAAHRYDHETDGGGEMTMVDQLLDSCTIAPRPRRRRLDRHRVARAVGAGRAALPRAAPLDSVAPVPQPGPRAPAAASRRWPPTRRTSRRSIPAIAPVVVDLVRRARTHTARDDERARAATIPRPDRRRTQRRASSGGCAASGRRADEFLRTPSSTPDGAALDVSTPLGDGDAPRGACSARQASRPTAGSRVTSTARSAASSATLLLPSACRRTTRRS